MSVKHKIILPFFLFFIGLYFAVAQTTEANIDTVFAENLASIAFTKNGIPLSLPILDMKSGGSVALSFDDLDADIKRYTYQIELCNRDWSPSQLEFSEYAEGFQDAKIIDYKPAYNTLIPYEHYSLVIPNQDIRLTKSGNYLLKIFTDAGAKTPVLTRRFMVVEPVVNILTHVNPSTGEKYNTHQDFGFSLSYKNFNISNPLNEIRASILQNGRWDCAKISIPPQYVQGDQIMYDAKDVASFKAGKEFRFIDLRTYRSRTERMRKIERGGETWEIYLIPDVDRSRQVYIKYKDVNGGFIIASYEEPDEPDLKGEYMKVHFALLQNDSIENGVVYVVGKFCDWQLKEENKMTYYNSPKGGFYSTTILMKQGVYNYQYVVKQKGVPTDFSRLEGDWYEAENEYTIFVYYRPFGARWDRIVGVVTFVSSQL